MTDKGGKIGAIIFIIILIVGYFVISNLIINLTAVSSVYYAVDLAIIGLALSMFTWGFDKAELLSSPKEKVHKKVLGWIYMGIAILLFLILFHIYTFLH
jgi:membrane protease YdiL (CAAX protease family)